MTRPHCSACTHFYPHAPDPADLTAERRGECRKGPPQTTLLPSPQGVLQLVGFPTFRPSESAPCDQFAAREESAPADPDAVSDWWDHSFAGIIDAKRQGNAFAAECLLDECDQRLRQAGCAERRSLVESLLGMYALLDQRAA